MCRPPSLHSGDRGCECEKASQKRACAHGICEMTELGPAAHLRGAVQEVVTGFGQAPREKPAEIRAVEAFQEAHAAREQRQKKTFGAMVSAYVGRTFGVGVRLVPWVGRDWQLSEVERHAEDADADAADFRSDLEGMIKVGPTATSLAIG